MRRTVLFALSALLAAACDSPSGSKGPPPSGPPTLTISGGSGQSAAVLQPLPQPVTVVVTDYKGSPLANQTVRWTVLTENGGSTAAATSLTDATGRAQTVWTLGTRAGAARLEASFGTAADTADATVQPGPAASLALAAGDTVRTLDAGGTLQLTLTAKDAHGNDIPGAAVAATWTSRDTSVAKVTGAATATVAIGGAGRTVLDVAAGQASLRVHLRVRGLAQRMQPFNRGVSGISGNGTRALATGLSSTLGRGLYQLQDGAWAYDASLMPYEDRARVAASGAGWVLGSIGPGLETYGLYHSPAAGAPWARVTTPINPNVLAVTGNTLFLSTYAATAGGVVRREEAGWTVIPQPTTSADSTLGIGLIAAGGTDDLYMTGVVQKGTTSKPFLARWNGTTTTRLALPSGINWTNNSGPMLLAAGAAGTAYAVMVPNWTESHRRRLLAINGNSVTPLANPVETAGDLISGISVAPDGSLYVAGMTMLARYSGGTWEQWPLRDPWRGTGRLHADASGRIWLGVSFYGNLDEPAMLEMEIIR
jgi:hypothetical protein